MITNFELCLSMIVKLQLDKYMLLKNDNRSQIKSHCGFKTKDFKVIEYLKKNALNFINHEKLDLISTLMPHLYNLNKIEMIIKRFELNKRKIKFLNFIKQIKNNRVNVNQNLIKNINSNELELYILKLIWKYRCKINRDSKGFFMKDRIPFNWYKLGLLHVFPIEVLKRIDLFNLEWPSLPVTRKKILALQDETYFSKINDLAYRAEDFWVNNNFESSDKNIMTFLKNN